MAARSDVVDQVSARLSLFVERMREETADYGPDAAAFVTAAEDTLHGGKRLRARFCHAGWAAVAGTRGIAAEPESLWDACAALEVFQSAALVHDDLIDNSDTRRGRPSAHRALESAHVEKRWSGNAVEFGRAASVLLGDLLVAWSDDLLESGIAHSPHADAVRAEYARMRRDVTIGQFLDIAEESAWSVNDDDEHAERALRVVSLKAARYSVEQPLLIGAAIAGADQAQRAALRAFGHPLGMAFQLRDDVLGVFGDHRVTGKPAGDDLREGKRTLLIAWTRESLAAPGRRLVDELLGDPLLTPDQIVSLQAAIVESGALDRVERLISDYAADGEEALKDAPLDAAALEILSGLARDATQRTA
ncbi:polyprenyl synthetase family protein [Microbacterium capsulatum]|uniref:Polyprenyl synthetase family protein n=1 Tax=Microbacterium capsulatum TaxID=3041921 RepID=A0ABU0XCX2_9MICO|nr:polyprenyl synthetase family protein [Microbacterium sp. ASV81]MDQ4212951.1 polyprenyl synthetase family protein [Microbacterium sp. ASV81]